ncbi:mucin-5AC-like [Lytechinus pictus]|uniref:mucin-5AC-like n=1 Tax=Lytechinus pictus TaxID=7653 RepID=UPI0030B9F232
MVSLEGMMFPFGRQKMLAMGVMLQILGIFMALIGAFLESVVASLIHHVDFSQCSYSSSGVANCTAELSCEAVQLSFPKSCYCCHLTKERFSPCYFRAVSLFEAPSMYAGVDSCSQVSGEYLTLLWTSVCFCAVCCFFGIIAAITTYSYRKAIKSPSIAISTTLTSPMLPQQTRQEGFVKSSSSSSSSSSSPGGSRSLDTPVPAPRNSLVRSSSNTVVGATPASTPAATQVKSSTLPKRKKRRAPGIPTSQCSDASEASPSSSAVVVVRPKRNSAALFTQSTENRVSSHGQRPTSAERPRSVDGRQIMRVSRSTENILRETRPERPRSATGGSRPADSPQRRPDSQRSSRTPAGSPLRTPSSSGAPNTSASRTQESSRTPTASPSRTPANVPENQEECQVSSVDEVASSTPSATSTSSSNDSAGASASPSTSASTDNNTTPKNETPSKTPIKKKKSHKKCPAPLTPPQLQQLQQEQLQQLQQQQQVLAEQQQAPAMFLPRNEPIPNSPPPPFVPERPPSPPPFTPSASIHYPHHTPHHPHQPVTNIHLTLHTTPMGANVQMPVTSQSGYLYHNQPTAPLYL